MANYVLPVEVAEILTASQINGNSLYLPPQQLDRKTYEAVNKAIENLGGKWNKKAKTHVFPFDPAPKIAEAK